MTVFCFDLDGTICTNTNGNYHKAKPFYDVIRQINHLYDSERHTIKIMTARGCLSGKEFSEFTEKQLKKWGVKYHQLIMNRKPYYDVHIDDKSDYASNWRFHGKRVGLIAGSFDLIHPGYIRMFKEAKTVCDHLVVALHVNPNSERKNKESPVQHVEDRREVLESIKYIDEVVNYKTEKDLYKLLYSDIQPHVRILGEDYKNKSFTGDDLEDIEIYYVKRNHSFSTTRLKKDIRGEE